MYYCLNTHHLFVMSTSTCAVHLSQNAPVCEQDIFWCVVCEHVSFTDISIVTDFLCGQVIYNHHMTFVDVRRSLCKNMTERCCVDFLYYLRKYSHILAHNDNIMKNTKLHIHGYCNLCVYMLFA